MSGGHLPGVDDPSPEAGPMSGLSSKEATDVLDPARADHFPQQDGAVFAGTHLILEVIGGQGLDDEQRIQRAFREGVTASGATLLHIHTHKFSPHGISAVAVLAESHITCHTWPEIGYGAFDVFMCGDTNPWEVVGVLKRIFETQTIHVKELRRGVGVVNDFLPV